MDKEILNKYFAGEASQKEKETIMAWVETNDQNYEEFLALRTLYDITIIHLPNQTRKPIKRINKINRRFLADLGKIAAAIIITFGCSLYFMHKKGSLISMEAQATMQTLHVPAGQRTQLILADSTVVWLNSLTTLKFPDHFSETSREVFLDGEAYFEVAHDKGRPFHVNTEKYTVKVLGTEFNVLAYSKNNLFETDLIEGAVEVFSNDGLQSLQLTPGNQAYLDNGRLIVSSISNYEDFLWKTGIINFDNMRIEDIFNKLRLYYDITIENHNSRIKDMRYTGKFRTKDGIEHVLNVLKVATGLRYTKDNEKNLIRIY